MAGPTQINIGPSAVNPFRWQGATLTTSSFVRLPVTFSAIATPSSTTMPDLRVISFCKGLQPDNRSTCKLIGHHSFTCHHPGPHRRPDTPRPGYITSAGTCSRQRSCLKLWGGGPTNYGGGGVKCNSMVRPCSLQDPNVVLEVPESDESLKDAQTCSQLGPSNVEDLRSAQKTNIKNHGVEELGP